MVEIIHAYLPLKPYSSKRMQQKRQSVSLLHVLITEQIHSKHLAWLPISTITNFHNKPLFVSLS